MSPDAESAMEASPKLRQNFHTCQVCGVSPRNIKIMYLFLVGQPSLHVFLSPQVVPLAIDSFLALHLPKTVGQDARELE